MIADYPIYFVFLNHPIQSEPLRPKLNPYRES